MWGGGWEVGFLCQLLTVSGIWHGHRVAMKARSEGGHPASKSGTQTTVKCVCKFVTLVFILLKDLYPIPRGLVGKIGNF